MFFTVQQSSSGDYLADTGGSSESLQITSKGGIFIKSQLWIPLFNYGTFGDYASFMLLNAATQRLILYVNDNQEAGAIPDSVENESNSSVPLGALISNFENSPQNYYQMRSMQSSCVLKTINGSSIVGFYNMSNTYDPNEFWALQAIDP